jgi:ribonuclease Z
MTKPINVSIFSKALYSSWCNHQTTNTLFDCGEGCATHIGNSLAGIERIFLSHDHGDHTLGLPSVIGCRNAGRGVSRNEDTYNNNKPLTVYYPYDNFLMESLIQFIDVRYKNWLRYKLEFVPIGDGGEVPIGNNQFVRAFEMLHQKKKTTLGYVIYEKRRRLKKEFVGQDIPALLKSGIDKDSINETYRANLFGYCLDAFKIDGDQLKDCDNVIMDCTFIDERDRTDDTHYSLEEARRFCADLNVKNMYAAHLSGRYNYNELVAQYPDVNFVNPFKVNHL